MKKISIPNRSKRMLKLYDKHMKRRTKAEQIELIKLLKEEFNLYSKICNEHIEEEKSLMINGKVFNHRQLYIMVEAEDSNIWFREVELEEHF